MARSFIILLLLLTSFTGVRAGDGVMAVVEHASMASAVALKACGVESQSPWGEMLAGMAFNYAFTAGTVWTMKHCIDERRPDHSDYDAFPSGHTAFAFAGATTLWHEYKGVSPWIGIAGFTVATAVGVQRVANDRHYTHDVLAGAAIGVLSTELTYFLKKRVFKTKKVELTFNPQGLNLWMAL